LLANLVRRVLRISAALLPAYAALADWPGFRGHDAAGLAEGPCPQLASNGPISLKLAWKRPLGSGYSAVAVAEGLVVTGFSDGAEDVVVAFDEETGEELWRTPLDATYKGHDGSHDGPIATPLIADGRIFMLAPRGRLVALEARSGREVWSTNLVTDHGAAKPHYGFSSSPLLMDGTLVLHLGSSHGAIAGFDPASGQRRWAAGEGVVQYQCPVAATLPGGRRVVVAASDSHVYALAPRDGAVVWEYAINVGVTGNEAHDPRGPGSLIPVACGDERLFLKHSGDKSLTLRLSGDGGQPAADPLWESNAVRNTYNVPVYYDGDLYAVSARFLTCVNAADGTAQWRSRSPGDGFLALAAGNLVIATKDGSMHIARATRSGYEERAGLTVFEALSWSPPAVTRDRIFVRSMDSLARVDVVAGASAQAAAEATRGGGEFEAMLAQVAAAGDKAKVIDAYLARQTRFPIIEGGRVHFVYRGPGQDLALGCETIGARQDRAMTRVADTDLFYLTTELEPDARVNYIFIRDYEDILDPLNPRKDTSSAYTTGMEVSFGRKPPYDMSWFAMPQWKPASNLDEPPAGAPRGKLERFEIDSPVLAGKMAFSVYTPPGYDASGPRLPVVYVIDGQAAVERGHLQNVLDNEIGKRVRPLIAVCMETPLRALDPRLAGALVKDLVPWIDGKFATHATPEGRMLMAAGFHAGLTLTTALEHADTFSACAAQSPFALRPFEETIGPAIEKMPSGRTLRVHVAWGKYDMKNPHEAWDMVASARATFEGLKAIDSLTVTGAEDRLGTDWGSWQHRLGDLLAAIAAK
jgi:outer membrane protein assembly factor BamB